MREDKIVQFVCFETILDSEQFITRWEEFIRPVNSDLNVTLQQSEKNGVFRYIAQHRSSTGEFQFVFTKARRSSRTAVVEISVKQAGGYSILQSEKIKDVHTYNNKVFVFLTNPATDLTIYRQLSTHSILNIYEAYYENCKYAYILEYFVNNKYAPELLEQLKLSGTAEIGIYKECVLQAL